MEHSDKLRLADGVPTHASGKIDIYYDGLCTMCSASMRTLEGSSKGDTFRAVDITKGTLPPGADERGALRNMHAVDSEGNIYVGADAVLRIIEEYPRWRWLSAIGKLPGIRHVLHVLYRLVATHRRRFNSLVK